MPHLHWLDLSYNLLNEMDYDSFRNSRRLQVHSTYKIQRFSGFAIHSLIHLFYRIFPQVIYLSQNQLQEIPQEIFKPLFELRVVGLSHNNLRNLPDGLFVNQGMES